MKNIFLFTAMLLIIVGCQGTESKKHKRQEPYIDIVTEEVKLTYDVEEGGLYYQRHSGYMIDNSLPSMEISCMVTNTSSHGGTFKLYATMSSQGDIIEFSVDKFIGAGQTVKITQEKDINDYTFQANVKVDSWEIIAPTKEIQKEVVKYRTVYY